MYQQYFGLTEQPFSIAVNPRYLFMSDRHRDALAHLLYGVGSGGGKGKKKKKGGGLPSPSKDIRKASQAPSPKPSGDVNDLMAKFNRK